PSFVVRRLRGSSVGPGSPEDRLKAELQTGTPASACKSVTAPGRIGDARGGDFAAMFRHSPICRMMRQPKEHGICTDCDHVASCGGGCRAAAFALTGRLDGSDLSCPVRRAKLATDPSSFWCPWRWARRPCGSWSARSRRSSPSNRAMRSAIATSEREDAANPNVRRAVDEGELLWQSGHERSGRCLGPRPHHHVLGFLA
ncbi:MAG: SPASM domain-containing protein, partial [Planctomycetes bacterium]|nr:SPASM domain-containing protein [Planctomycetota bacterium]